MAVVAFILILSFLVLIHELGHFVLAKFFRVEVEEFGLGYPPRAKTLFRRWDTNFTLNWVPFGGFVKMVGEEGEPEGVATATQRKKVGPFNEKSTMARLLIILAGALVNLIFGVIAFSVIFSVSGIPTPSPEPLISQIQTDSPAAQAGLPARVKITNVKIGSENWQQPTIEQVISIAENHRGQTAELTTTGSCVKDTCDTSLHQYQVEIRTADQTPAGQGAMGIVFESVKYVFYPWYEMPFRAIWFGLEQTFWLSTQIVSFLRLAMVNLVAHGSIPAELSGPVGIVHQAQTNGLFSQGWLAVLSFTGMLSVNLGVMNLLPIPALDGGRAFFIILESLIGRRWVNKIEGYANYGGFVFLIGLIVLVTARDIMRIIYG